MKDKIELEQAVKEIEEIYEEHKNDTSDNFYMHPDEIPVLRAYRERAKARKAAMEAFLGADLAQALETKSEERGVSPEELASKVLTEYLEHA